VGGSGKTPVVEYLINLLKSKYQIVTLSRGYKRKTRGLILAGSSDSAKIVGDEPAQLFNKYGEEIGVAVCEDRLFAIPHILDLKPETNLILFDDAFQHRRINPTINILLSDFNHPFYRDWILPAGNLRESRKNANRADLIIITKCPYELNDDDIQSIISNIRKYVRNELPVFFMNIQYHSPVVAFGKNKVISDNIILVTGIAQPNPNIT
jgi:tetraacyldisaccharide 4'-kinase